MRHRRLFLDTSFLLAQVNERDIFHKRAHDLVAMLDDTPEVFVTTHVLAEICNSLARTDRSTARTTVHKLESQNNVIVVHIGLPTFWEAFELYCQRGDKTWGLTDCISFKVMEREGIKAALTCDRHFEQAGFKALLLHEPA